MTSTDSPAPVAPAPFLRWAGGKRRLLKVIAPAMPTEMGKFYEPFLGGGALYFSLAHPGARCVVNDTNEDLIAAYRVLQTDPEALIGALSEHQSQVSADWFYALRATEPATDLERAARFIAYNRTSFNGLFRVNSKGGWNTPYGKLKNPTISNGPLLRADSARLSGTDIRCGSYLDATAGAADGDFVYYDPPYLPLTATSSFSKYAKDDFTPGDHSALAERVSVLASSGVRAMLSNSDTPLTREIFAGMHQYQVHVQRSISAKASSRESVAEVLAVTYPLEDMVDAEQFLKFATPLP